MSRERPLPPVYFMASLLAMLALHFLIPGPRLFGSFSWLAGALPIAFGVVLNLWADRLFKRHGTEVKPFRDSSTLVLEGPFRFTRNPMYLGGLSMLAGIAIGLGTTTPFIVLPVSFWLTTAHFIRPEEEALARQFGERYGEYRRKVRRWL